MNRVKKFFHPKLGCFFMVLVPVVTITKIPIGTCFCYSIVPDKMTIMKK